METKTSHTTILNATGVLGNAPTTTGTVTWPNTITGVYTVTSPTQLSIRKVTNGWIVTMQGADYVFATIPKLVEFIEKNA